MSFSTARLSLPSKIVSPAAFRPSVRHTVRSRGALQVRNATLWSLSQKGKEVELTDTVGKKSICGVAGKSDSQGQDKVQSWTLCFLRPAAQCLNALIVLFCTLCGVDGPVRTLR